MQCRSSSSGSKRLGITRKKKTLSYQERDEKRREKFRKIIALIAKEGIVYIDETGMDQYLSRPYRRAPKGLPAYGKISSGKSQRTSIVAGQCVKCIVAPLQHSGTMDSVLFMCWLSQKLLPTLPKASVIVMDNASFGSKKRLEELAQQAGCSVLFLLPYSPELNPIEKFWAWMKVRLRKILHYLHSLDHAVHDVFKLE